MLVLNYVWLSNNVPNINWLCREIQLHSEQKWNSDVYNSLKCINYRTFKIDLKKKTEFKTVFYLKGLQTKFYIPMARFRTTNHREGRLENIERSQRFCTLCNRNGLGDESYYLLECNFFKESRKTYFTRYYLQYPYIIKSHQLLSLRNVKLLLQLSRFISFVISKF